MSELGVIGPRVTREVRCPYCRHEVLAVCRRPVGHETLQTCTACGGVLVVRFNVTVTPIVLEVYGELDRIADEQQERLELERKRSAAGGT